MAVKKTAKTVSFEAGLAKLEELAAQMEKSELPLDELLKLYEEGTKLASELTRKLDEMDGRMQEIQLGQNGATVLAPTDVVRQESLLDSLDQ